MLCNDLIEQAEQQVLNIIEQAVENATQKGELPTGELPQYTVEIPADTSFGDFASNIAMVGAKAWRMAPPKIAEIILNNMNFANTYLTQASVAGPGFLNFTLSHEWFTIAVSTVNTMGKNYGRTDFGKGEKVVVEFVSANPTGPMHLGNARGGVTGDCLAAILDFTGHDVKREFYLNDAGNQVKKFGQSLGVRYLEFFGKSDPADFPEDGYHGDDIKENVQAYIEKHGDSLLEKPTEEREAALADFALPYNIGLMKDGLERYRVVYDTWFSEQTLHTSGAVDEMFALLTEKGLTYEKDGAVWYKASEFGGEKDEVIIRSNGTPTYFGVDIAYHYNKFVVRGYHRAINLWGADHHGHVARLKGAMDAIGLDGNNLEIVLFQHVRFMKNGEPFRMSKRSGKAVSLSDLLDMVLVDAARFFFNMREIGSTMDFDLGLAVEESSQNPVYYVQYAHARICSLFKKVAQEGTVLREVNPEELAKLTAPEEIELIRSLAYFPHLLVNLAKKNETAGLTHYVSELATLFHKFYSVCHVNVEDESLKQARLALCLAAQTTLANVLGLMKISAPESM